MAKEEECTEFLALAVPNVLGGGLLAYMLAQAAYAAGPSETMNWVVGLVLVVLYAYSNVGEAEGGKAFEAKKAAARRRGLSLNVPKSTCAFLGLGRMGSLMAGNLAKQDNIQLRVWNRNEAVTKAHAEKYASQACATVEEATKDCDMIFMCLPTTDVVAQVTQGFKPSGKKVFVVDCTSGEPEKSKEVAAKLKEKNYIYVDAPVSGGPKGAENATLTIMVGAESKDDFNQVSKILEVMGVRVIHAGPVGAGHAVKAVNNSFNASALLLSAEGLAALASYGVDPEVALSVINASSGRNLATEVRIPEQVLNRKFDFGFALGLMAKDNNIATSLLKDGLQDNSYISLTAKLLQEAEKSFGPDADFTSCVKLFEEKLGAKIEHHP